MGVSHFHHQMAHVSDPPSCLGELILLLTVVVTTTLFLILSSAVWLHHGILDLCVDDLGSGLKPIPR